MTLLLVVVIVGGGAVITLGIVSVAIERCRADRALRDRYAPRAKRTVQSSPER